MIHSFWPLVQVFCPSRSLIQGRNYALWNYRRLVLHGNISTLHKPLTGLYATISRSKLHYRYGQLSHPQTSRHHQHDWVKVRTSIIIAKMNLIFGRGMRCEFLPPYSPDFNPIELAFSAMKFHLRRNGDLVRMAMTELSDEDIFLCLLDALYVISPMDCRGWYKYCGY